MRTRRFFVGILTAGLVVLATGTGEAEIHSHWFTEEGKLANPTISALELHFLELRIEMMMSHPDEYPSVDFTYDERGGRGKMLRLDFPEVKLDTRGKIVVTIMDTRDYFPSSMSEREVLEKFRSLVLGLRLRLWGVTEDLDNDAVVLLIPKEGTLKRGLLAYFYEGEYVMGPFFMGPERIKRFG